MKDSRERKNDLNMADKLNELATQLRDGVDIAIIIGYADEQMSSCAFRGEAHLLSGILLRIFMRLGRVIDSSPMQP